MLIANINIRGLILSSFLFYSSFVCRSHLRIAADSIKLEERPPIYLPRVEAVKLVSLGYNKAFSNIFWFTTLNYFGTKFKAKESMPWFSHMCEVVTSLDPKAKHVFEFCGTLLSWIGRDVDSSNKILTSGILEDPTYWKYFYLRGFNNWYFKEDFVKAREDMETASRLPNAPTALAGLASSIISSNQSPEAAISFLKNSINMTKDVLAKEALEAKLKLAIVRKDIISLNKNSDNQTTIKDPWGEYYKYDNNLNSYI